MTVGKSARQTAGVQQILRISKQEEELEFILFPNQEGEPLIGKGGRGD